jgi:hypothetical protein
MGVQGYPSLRVFNHHPSENEEPDASAAPQERQSKFVDNDKQGTDLTKFIGRKRGFDDITAWITFQIGDGFEPGLQAAARAAAPLSAVRETGSGSKDGSEVRTVDRRLNDVVHALIASLREGVTLGLGMKSSQEEIEAITSWLHLLQCSFPMEGFRTSIRALHARMQHVPPEEWSGELWSLELKDWELREGAVFFEHLSEQKGVDIQHSAISSGDMNWDWCEESSSGYTCGLWSLFHMLALNSDSSENAAVSSSSGDCIVTDRETFEGIREFIEHFFGCEVCRDHFLDQFPASLAATFEGPPYHDSAVDLHPGSVPSFLPSFLPPFLPSFLQ